MAWPRYSQWKSEVVCSSILRLRRVFAVARLSPVAPRPLASSSVVRRCDPLGVFIYAEWRGGSHGIGCSCASMLYPVGGRPHARGVISPSGVSKLLIGLAVSCCQVGGHFHTCSIGTRQTRRRAWAIAPPTSVALIRFVCV